MQLGALANRCQGHVLLEATSSFPKRKDGATNGMDLTLKVDVWEADTLPILGIATHTRGRERPTTARYKAGIVQQQTKA